MDQSVLEYVIAELNKRKGQWPQISREMEPDNWEAHYSWMTKVIGRSTPDPRIRRIEALAERFRSEEQEAA